MPYVNYDHEVAIRTACEQWQAEHDITPNVKTEYSPFYAVQGQHHVTFRVEVYDGAVCTFVMELDRRQVNDWKRNRVWLTVLNATA